MHSTSPTGRRAFLKCLGAGALSLAGAGRPWAAQAGRRPDIVIILADDMGFSDAGCYGGEIATPNIDRLAAGGLRFTQFYNCARCCPTRASLLTGQYPHEVGLRFNGRSLARNGLTIAEALRTAGYNTAMSGKWHLSQTPALPDKELHQKWLDHRHDPDRPFAPLDSHPVNRGFDRHYGIIWGVINYFDPFSLVEGEQPVREVPEDYYITDAITDKAVEYVHQMSREDRPFFLYVAHCAPHWPLHARPQDIARYADTYQGGPNRLRQERYSRMIQMGLFEKTNTPLPEIQGQGPVWDDLSEGQKRYQAAKMAVHAAMVDRMDQGVGRLIEALRNAGRLDNTVIFFLIDNGASPEVPTEPGYDRNDRTRDGRKIRYSGFDAPGPQTTYTGIGPYWASAANTPFRYWKKESFEGGCHTPLIVHWPAGLKTAACAVTDQSGHVMDIMPTCLELAGAAYPDEYQGHKLTAVRGKSLLPILKADTREPHGSLFFEHEGGRAIRQGDWKLVALSNGPWRLYDLKADRTETHDLAAQHSGRVLQMEQDWKAWAAKMGLDTKD